MKHKKRNLKKGAAIELALLAVFVAVALGGLIVSLSLLGTRIKNDNFDRITDRVRYDKVMEGYLWSDDEGFSVDNYGERWETTEDGANYTINKSGGGEEPYVFCLIEDGEIVLTVKVKDKKIIEWKY